MTMPMPFLNCEPEPHDDEQIFVDVSHLEPIIQFMAQTRQASNRARGTPDDKISSRPSLEIEMRGIAAELSFCMHYNLWPDLDLRPRSGGYDCIYRDIPAHIKEAPAHGSLLDKNYVKVRPGEAYVLCAGTDFKYRIVGWCWSDELIRNENLKYWDVRQHAWIPANIGQATATERYPPTYVLSQDKLRRMSDFGAR